MATDSPAAEQLPSLPQVLVRILDTLQSERADFQRLAEIVRHDAAIATRLIGVANSSFYRRAARCESVERALLFLGTDTVKTIVITAAIKQFYGRFNSRHQPFLTAFWRRSLISANFAHILANLTSYRAPDEAYLSGLLMDMGQLILLSRHGQRYLDVWSAAADDRDLLAQELEHFQTTHAELAANLIEGWQLGGFMADAVRYHHEGSAQILDAQHLVKITNLASLLSTPGGIGDEAVAQADQLFGLTEALTQELRLRISADVERMALNLNIDIGDNANDRDAHDILGDRLSELGQLGQVSADLWRSESLTALEQAVVRTLYLTLDIERSLLFVVDPAGEQLTAFGIADDSDSVDEAGRAQTAKPDFALPIAAGRSLVGDALLAREATLGPMASVDKLNLSVLDRQLLKQCRAEQLLCLPLSHRDIGVGVLVLGLPAGTDDPREKRSTLLTALTQEIAGAVHHHTHSAEDLDNTLPLQQRIREAVHEAGNPLSIIRNYLEMLRLKLGDQHQANADLNLIKEEIDRVGSILLRLRDPHPIDDHATTISLNQLIEDLAQILDHSLCATHQITLTLDLGDESPMLQAHVTQVKQILTNLLKNAVEALPPGGRITVSSETNIIVDGRHFASFTVADNGSGLPEPVLKHLFTPVSSSKGNGHAGLGLSICKKLVDEISGSIVCRSSKRGTQFQVLIPI
jgi:HD-like signal output (HDOD) protein/nitrogen-specific signal transduction histidine kinase